MLEHELGLHWQGEVPEAPDGLSPWISPRRGFTYFIETLVKIAKSNKATDAARVSACVVLLDRGWGKPDKTHHHNGDIRQHIISDRPLTVDEWTAKYCGT